MAGDANREQTDYWNSSAGRIWVDEAADLDTLLGSVTDLIVEAAAPGAGERAVDIGCGGGASTFELAKLVGPSGRVLGLDISSLLLDHAERRRQDAGLANVSFVLADAQTHRFERGTFDLAVSRFGVMFFSDPTAALRNIGTALTPGGRIIFAAWAGAERNPWFSIPQRIAEQRLGKAEPSAPLEPGPMAFRDVDQVVDLLRDAGLSNCSGETVTVDLHHPGGLESVVGLTTRVGPTARLMREKEGTPEDLAAMSDAIARAFAPFATPDEIRIPAGINLFRATSP